REDLNYRIFNLGGGEECRILYEDFLSRSFRYFGLGKLNFPKYAFARKNFHCGFYEDSDELDDILNFRQDTIESYFGKLKTSVSPVKRLLAGSFRPLIKYHLLKQSEPYRAFLNKDIRMIRQFF
ncbi:MAG: NAD-dependent epimerase/dehydratase family protein, partial [Bacteroidales bacterium]